MKAKVVMPFTDRATKKTYKTGEIIECTEARFAEIKKVGNFVVAVNAEKVAEPEKK